MYFVSDRLGSYHVIMGLKKLSWISCYLLDFRRLNNNNKGKSRSLTKWRRERPISAFSKVLFNVSWEQLTRIRKA